MTGLTAIELIGCITAGELTSDFLLAIYVNKRMKRERATSIARLEQFESMVNARKAQAQDKSDTP